MVSAPWVGFAFLIVLVIAVTISIITYYYPYSYYLVDRVSGAARYPPRFLGESRLAVAVTQ